VQPWQLAAPCIVCQLRGDVLHDYDGGIDEHTDGNGEPAQAHEVGRHAELLHSEERRERG
jgi:hypothetical protein